MEDNAKKIKENVSYRMEDTKHKKQKQPYYDKFNQHALLHQSQEDPQDAQQVNQPGNAANMDLNSATGGQSFASFAGPPSTNP